MAYKSKKRQLAYMKRWRQKHPGYMRTYYLIAVRPFNKTDRTHAVKVAA